MPAVRDFPYPILETAMAVPMISRLRVARRWTAAVVCMIAAATATAAPLAAPWGGLQEQPPGSGRYEARIDQWPADGRLAMPAGFPQIVRASLADGGGTAGTDLMIELNADATAVAVLLPKTPPAGGGGLIHLATADETKQFDDGRIVFTARDAKVDGTKAKLETHPGNHRIGFWVDPADTVHWTRPGTRWGRYAVGLTYSTASPNGTEIEIEINGTKLPATLTSTGSWYRYATLPVGTVYLAEAGPQHVTVRCTKKVGAAVMNLKAVTLEPACEGTSPVQAADATVTLHGRDATVVGTTLRYEPAEKKQTLGYWTKPGDAARWTFTVTQPGSFDVEVLQGCGTGQGGSTMRITVDGEAQKPIEFVVEDTGGFQAFKPRIVGRVTLAAGEHVLHVQPLSIAKAAACDIRQIRLVPQ